MLKVEIHHFNGETPIEKQHTHEMDTLKILHRLGGHGKSDEFFELLETIENEDKRKDFAWVFGMWLNTASPVSKSANLYWFFFADLTQLLQYFSVLCSFI